MERKQTVDQNALAEILSLLDCLKIKYWIEGGWGIDLLLGKQSREHRDVDVDFDSRHTERLLRALQEAGYHVVTDQLPTRAELYHPRLGFLDIHPFVIKEDGSARQADLNGGWYEFASDFFTAVNWQGRCVPCISAKAQKLFHSGYELREVDRIDLEQLEFFFPEL